MIKQSNIFKNSGIRNKITTNSFITPKNMRSLGHALSIYILKKYRQSVNIIISTDTRPSGTWIKKNLVQELAHNNHTIFDAGIVPTPFIAKALKDYKKTQFQLGIMITASHNPAEYNGIKIMTPDGYLTLEDEQEISNLFYKYKSISESTLIDTSILTHPIDLLDFYISETKKILINKTFQNISLLVDCANGATYQIAKKVFKSYNINTTCINDSSDGSLINYASGCSNPQLLIQALKKHNMTWACGFDGDGDRAILIHKNGTILDGDDFLTILSEHPLLQNESIFIGTIMSNKATEDTLLKKNKTLIRTDVGERNLIETLHKHNGLLGSEACGHITFMNHAYCSDGIFAILLFFDAISQSQLLDIEKSQKIPQLHDQINIENQNIEQSIINKIIKKNSCPLSRIIARKSNTEPVLRIMIEHPNSEEAHLKLTSIKNEFKKYINERM